MEQSKVTLLSQPTTYIYSNKISFLTNVKDNHRYQIEEHTEILGLKRVFRSTKSNSRYSPLQWLLFTDDNFIYDTRQNVELNKNYV